MSNELPPRDLEMEARSMEAFQRGDSIPLQQRIFELRAEAVKKYIEDNPSIPVEIAIQEAVHEIFIVPLQEKIASLEKYGEAIEMIENGRVVAVSVLDLGGYSITVKSGIASVSSTYDDIPLVDAIIAAGKAYTQ
jgi:predicted RNase H-like nuclease (RuvC/YqgF family)